MKAIMISEYGGPDRMILADVPEPQAGPAEVLVRLEYAGVNFIDVYMRNGLYKRSDTYVQSLPLGHDLRPSNLHHIDGRDPSDLHPNVHAVS